MFSLEEKKKIKMWEVISKENWHAVLIAYQEIVIL